MPKNRSNQCNYVGLEIVADEVTVTALNGALTGVTTFTDNSGGTASNTLAAVAAGATYSQADIVALKMR
jgi:hypothetical protein